MAKPDLPAFTSLSYKEMYEIRMEEERNRKSPTFQEMARRLNPKNQIKGILHKDLLEGLNSLKRRQSN
jgi:hypothetical protein